MLQCEARPEQSVKIDLNIRKSSTISSLGQNKVDIKWQCTSSKVSTYSVSQLTLVRGSSLSLVDLPTFLPPLPLEVTKNIPIISSLSNNQHPFNKVGTQDNLIAPKSVAFPSHPLSFQIK